MYICRYSFTDQNKNKMKKIAVILSGVLLAALLFPAMARADRPVTVAELPAAAQQFIKTHFPKGKVAYAKVDDGLMDRDYEVVFADGVKIEFAKDGSWKEIDCKYAAVPEGIVPEPIARYVAEHFAERRIVKLDRDRRFYEAELDNGLELKFDHRFRLLEIDD